MTQETELQGFSTVGKTEKLMADLLSACEGLSDEQKFKIGWLVRDFIKESFVPSDILYKLMGK